MKLMNLGLMLGLTIAACSKDKNDPATLSKDELSPPVRLMTITGDNQVELRWQAQNFEDDLQGYHVFKVEKSIANFDTASLPAYPVGVTAAKLAAGASVPRCEGNNAFFAVFGIDAKSEKDCEDTASDTEEEKEEEGVTLAPASVVRMIAPTMLADEEKSSILQAKLTCYDPAAPETSIGDANLSLIKNLGSEYRDGQGVQRCLIKDGVENGKTYTFVVVAVLGDDFDEVSWTSNLVEDTPAKAILPTTNIELTRDGGVNYVTVALNATTVTETPEVSDGTTKCNNAATVCTLAGANADAAGGIYFGRDNESGTYKGRVFISTSTAGDIELRFRGPLTNDPLTAEAIDIRTPGDQAKETLFAPKGTKFPLYDNAVYDLKVTRSGVVHYGKVVVGDLTYATPTDNESKVTVPVTIVMQSAAGVVHYFQ